MNITITAASGDVQNISTILAGAITNGTIQQALIANGLSVTNVQVRPCRTQLEQCAGDLTMLFFAHDSHCPRSRCCVTSC